MGSLALDLAHLLEVCVQSLLLAHQLYYSKDNPAKSLDYLNLTKIISHYLIEIFNEYVVNVLIDHWYDSHLIEPSLQPVTTFCS